MIYEQTIPVEKEQNEQTIAVDSVPSEQNVSVIQESVNIIGGESYEGSYTVTPSETAQTLETNGFKMEDDVTVNAIPSDYVGSSVPRKDSSDLSTSGSTVSVPAGYYEENASKAIPNATISNSTNVTVNPTLSVNYETGEITASVSKTQSVNVVTSAGYAPITSHNVVMSGNVGTQLITRDATDMTVSDNTVTAPDGYYPNSASKSIPNATWKSASTVGVVPEITVSSSGLITANASGWTSIHPLTASGYADSDTAANIQLSGSKTSQLDTVGATTYTPNKTSTQIIAAGKYLTGDQTIGMIPSSYYDMSLDMSWLGADATLVHEITPITVALKDTDFNSWTPATSASTVVASQTLSSDSQKYVATDLMKDDGYNYIHVWNMKMPIVYTGSPTQKALPMFSCGLLIQSIFRRSSSYANILIGNLNNNVAAQTTVSSFLRYYGSTTGTITYTWSASYGFYYANVAPSISSTTAQSPTITLKTPSMSARCSTTYMSTTNAGLIDKTNTKLTYTCKVYRVKQSAYLEGFYKYLEARVAEMDS